MGYLTESQITAKIDIIMSAIDVVVGGGKSYRLNDGQGDIQVTRESLTILQKSLDYWVAKHDSLTAGSGILSMQVHR